MGTLFCFPYLFLASALSSAATYALLTQADISALKAFGSALSRWKLLFPAALLAGVVSLLGLAALILPGIYFLAVYLFVPYVIMEEANQPVVNSDTLADVMVADSVYGANGNAPFLANATADLGKGVVARKARKRIDCYEHMKTVVVCAVPVVVEQCVNVPGAV